MNFSVVCSSIAFLMLVGYAQVESADCPENVKQELKAVAATCFPDAETHHQPDQNPPPTPSPQEMLRGFKCLVREVEKTQNLKTLISSCGTASESATESEMETYMTCVDTKLNSAGCIPKAPEHHN